MPSIIPPKVVTQQGGNVKAAKQTWVARNATPYPKVSTFKERITWSFCESKRDLWNCEAMNTNFSLFNLEGTALFCRPP